MGTPTVVARAGLAGIIAAAGLLSAGTSSSAAQPSADNGPVTTSSPSTTPSTAHELMVLTGKFSLQGKESVNLDGFQCPDHHPYLMPGTYSEMFVPHGIEVKASHRNGQVLIHDDSLMYKDGKPRGWVRGDEVDGVGDWIAFAVNFDPEPVSISIIAHCQNIRPD